LGEEIERSACIFIWSQVTKYFAPSIRKLRKYSRPRLGYFSAEKYACAFTKAKKTRAVQSFLIRAFVTLTIQDSKPVVQFLKELGNVISHFENKPIYQPFEQIALEETIP